MKASSLLPVAILLQLWTYTQTAEEKNKFKNVDRDAFAADLYKKIFAQNGQDNVIFSPTSIQTSLALAYLGANGKTAEEMRRALKLGRGEPIEIAQNFADFLTSGENNNFAEIRMANRMYIPQNTCIKPEYEDWATNYFQSEVVKVNFAKSANAVKTINSWVESQTEHKIKDLLDTTGINQDTSIILVNAIYFVGLWAMPFNRYSTRKIDFTVNGKRNVKVDMMYREDFLAYADLQELDAKAVELPYKQDEFSLGHFGKFPFANSRGFPFANADEFPFGNLGEFPFANFGAANTKAPDPPLNNSTFRMLLLLPNKRDGLGDLANKLTGKNLNNVAAKLKVEFVAISLPKFRIEFGLNLEKPLKELGMQTMFTNQANFSRLCSRQNKISKVVHKAYIDVDERGSEVETFKSHSFVSSSFKYYSGKAKVFRADHPFVFAIRSSTAIYLMGHVTKF